MTGEGFEDPLSMIPIINKIIATPKDTIIVMTLDVRNVFNSATWSKIIVELHKRDIYQYLVILMESYFHE